MDLSYLIAPSPVSDWSEVDGSGLELARKVQGTVYRKHILTRGTLLHPETGSKIQIDDDFVRHLQQNFDNNVCDIVQVPLANDQNRHVENPAANLGEVVGIEDDKSTGKVYAMVDARKHAGDFGKTLLGASAFLHMNYKDSKTGQRVGPTLLHVAVTNRPYVTGLDPYEPVVAASAEDLGEPALVRMSGNDREDPHMPRQLEEVLAELSADHKIDVNALKAELTSAQEKVTAAESRASDAETKLSAVDTTLAERIATALKGSEEGAKLAAGDASEEDVLSAVKELATRNVTLSNAQEEAGTRIAALEKRNTEVEIDGLISDGRILPAKREAFLTMALTNRELFDQIVPDEPIVKMSKEQGSSPQPEEQKKGKWDVTEEIARLTGEGGPAHKYVSA